MPTATVISAGPPTLSWYGTVPAVVRGVSSTAPLATLQRVLTIRLAEYAALPARPSYSDAGRSEAWDAHRETLLNEIERLQVLIGSPAASGGVPWTVSTPY